MDERFRAGPGWSARLADPEAVETIVMVDQPLLPAPQGTSGEACTAAVGPGGTVRARAETVDERE